MRGSGGCPPAGFARENKSSAAAHQRSIHAERIPNREHRPRRSCAHQADGHAVLRRRLHSLAVGESGSLCAEFRSVPSISMQQPILLLIHYISSFMTALPPTKCWRHCGFRCGCPIRSQPRRPRTPAIITPIRRPQAQSAARDAPPCQHRRARGEQHSDSLQRESC